MSRLDWYCKLQRVLSVGGGQGRPKNMRMVCERLKLAVFATLKRIQKERIDLTHSETIMFFSSSDSLLQKIYRMMAE
jgi:hypothetical protein